MMTLVYGGSSSGKSAFTEQLAMESEAERFYVATMIAWDEECRERIRKHRAMRKEKRFTTLEAPVDVGDVSFPEGSTVLLECVSNLAANESFRADFKEPGAEAMDRILSGIETLRRHAGELFVVTNDVSGDGERFSEETENYRKLLGEVNQRLARLADRVYEVTGGIPVRLKEGKAGKDVHMILVTGGAHQGKRAVAKRLSKERETAELIFDLQDSIREIAVGILEGKTEEQAERELMDFLERLVQDHPEAVITCDELGCGIVPMKKEDRLWRELTGDACQYLAARAGAVCRVVCGIPVFLKGGEPE